jgi:hypothetical protein
MAWLNHRHDWPGLKAVAVVESTREINGKTEKETRFYITSLTAPASLVEPAIRDHWHSQGQRPSVGVRGRRRCGARVPAGRH